MYIYSLMKIFRVKARKLAGSDYEEVYRKAYQIYKPLKNRTRRRPYIRSAYFNKQKIFLRLFWEHLSQKFLRERVRRLKYFACALELMQHSRCEPVSKENVDRTSEILHRFEGETSDGEHFFVQIKEQKKDGGKWFMSVFPE